MEREELWCVNVETLGFEGMTGYLTAWYYIKTNVAKISYSKEQKSSLHYLLSHLFVP